MTPNVDKVDILDILNDAKDVVMPKVDNVDKKSRVLKCWRVDDRISIRLTQISWTVSLIYKWMILYLLVYTFTDFKIKFEK